MNDFSRNIRMLRISKDWSQQFMADRLGMSQANYARLESGKVKLDMSRLEEILNILEIPLDTVLNPRKTVLEESVLNLTNEYILKLRSEKEDLLRIRVEKLEDEVKFLRALLLQSPNKDQSKESR
ncbi:MAG: helix-turn-helix transcriptional regulator [Flavobacteriales bacterium]|jgi:transcriptional regulator with XRE-family HTH domain|nr:helix-turn-helix transcriptional regulator [Flavobacteriales bacterium]NCG29340.1 helix-turn-helix domain-containing protein [Bacteroidota bacterium]MBT3964651.1 helix-turn-helix transcriptional regulator [Flavobacteriales bacterium]MBT4704228.1 helix-turn-helix transcriptional regulator [Flavobacteriales bacterium]MBT4929950.1 helix-turn-helix transcriptional regulator [Flavobacteriales bacterium]